jgi:hypothetical protein
MLPPDLVAKLNECAKTNFIGARDVSLFWQSMSSWAVIVGLVLEGPELIYDMLSILRTNIQRFRYSIILRENRVELAKVAAFVGWIFIIIGLFGELRYGSKIADSNASIQGCGDAKVREATLEAGDAKDSALKAQESADAAGISSGKAQGKAKAAEASATRAGNLAKAAESDARNTQQYAAELRVELESFKLEASAIMSGHIFRRGDFKYAMSRGGGNAEITIVEGARSETKAFGENLRQAFVNSKWHVSSTRMTAGGGVVRRNKWASSPAIVGPITPPAVRSAYEIDPDLVAPGLVALSKGKLNWGEALSLSALSAALNAKLQKEDDLPNDTIRIIIGDP